MSTHPGRGLIGRALATSGNAAALSHRAAMVRSYLHRWAEAAGAHLLLVDPGPVDGTLSDALAGRGVHLTWVDSTVDGLIEFGRTDPHVVVLTPTAPGMAATDFVRAVTDEGTTYVVVGVEHDAAEEAGELLLAGAHAVVSRPYDADSLWKALHHSSRPLDDHAHVSFGPIELDAGAYSVRVAGERIADLPLKEFELLRALLLAAPEVVTDDDLRRALWGSVGRQPSGNTIAMHVTRLRHRLDGAAVVRRIRGRGYSLTV